MALAQIAALPRLMSVIPTAARITADLTALDAAEMLDAKDCRSFITQDGSPVTNQTWHHDRAGAPMGKTNLRRWPTTLPPASCCSHLP